ncbi:MAG: hypothetical protein LBC61_00740 [Candidatus Peribacteria bacterium]|nr:hypothetical protein [Candidatus Peribacteria bacterium]
MVHQILVIVTSTSIKSQALRLSPFLSLSFFSNFNQTTSAYSLFINVFCSICVGASSDEKSSKSYKVSQEYAICSKITLL